MRKLQGYVAKYGPEVGPKFYHLLQSRAARVGVSARLRRKIAALEARPVADIAPATEHADRLLLFPEAVVRDESAVCPIAEASVVG